MCHLKKPQGRSMQFSLFFMKMVVIRLYALLCCQCCIKIIYIFPPRHFITSLQQDDISVPGMNVQFLVYTLRIE
jgi:hypothetical protein